MVEILQHPYNRPNILKSGGSTMPILTTRPRGGGSEDQAISGTAITNTTATNPIVCTATDHGYQDGESISQFGTANELADGVFIVNNATDDTYELTGMDGADIDGTSGGSGTGGMTYHAFTHQPGDDEFMLLRGFKMVIAGSTALHVHEYVDIEALTNGMLFEIWNKDGFVVSVTEEPIRNFEQLALNFDVKVLSQGAQSGQSQQFSDLVVEAVRETNDLIGWVRIDGNEYDTIVVRVQDDLTELESQEAILLGSTGKLEDM